ncbi:MAG: AMP-binding protein, partial [Acidobacteria bacterium]|nr:AMP-binding protein [Acidobacteriota bacterium]
RYNFSERQRLFSIYTISPHTVSDYYRELQKFQPDYFEGYPSAMYLVARFMKEKNLQGIRPRAIISFAETLLAEQRRMLEEQFGCRVFDWYGTSEGSVHIMQCDQGTYHVCAEFGYVEVLDSRGNPVPAGESGEIVGTSFVNRCHPLIRFETGDIGVASDRVCPCGRGLPAFESIIGRKDDVIITADGRHLSRLDGVFKNTYHIREAQIVQEDLQSVQVFVVTDPGFEDFDRETLLENLRHYIGDQMTFRISPVRAIDRTAAGKFRSVISKLPPRDVAESKKPNQ